MAGRVRGMQDALAGALFIGLGIAAVYVARDYPLGTTMRMGPGYFPIVLGILLALSGIAVVARGLTVRGESLSGFALGPLLLVLGAVASFAFTVERLGIIAAVALVVVVSSLASGRFRWFEVVGLAVLMTALAVGLFTRALGLPFRLLPG